MLDWRKVCSPSHTGSPGDERFVDFIYQPIKDENGEVTGIFVAGADVTDRTTAEIALHRLNETLEQQVAIERIARGQIGGGAAAGAEDGGVGQLTGGIAHDFNNMLAVDHRRSRSALRRLERGDTSIEKVIRFSNAREGGPAGPPR